MVLEGFYSKPAKKHYVTEKTVVKYFDKNQILDLLDMIENGTKKQRLFIKFSCD